MARLPRRTVAGYPHHVIQRGNNRQVIFASDADRRMLLALLWENAGKFGVAIHAYVLMDNHFHLLATPPSAEALSQMMQAVGRRYVRHFNDAQERTGTLWEGRYKSALVQTDRYLLACMAYIDLNPVRAGLVMQPQDYRWSSHRHYVGLEIEKRITPHPLVWELGNTPFARESGYSALVQAGITERLRQAVTQSAFKGWVLGDDKFIADLQKMTPRRLSKGTAGRPVRVKPAMS